MAAIIGILSALTGIGSLVCWIWTLIKIFGDEQDGGVGKGILAVICGIYAFIWGWMFAAKHNHKNVMLIWTACIVVSILVQIVGGVMMAGSM